MRVTGIGGVFLRAADPEKLYAWYEEHLGIKRTEGGFMFFSEGPREMTVLAFFPMDTSYFGPTEQRVMLNLRVDDLDPVLEKLRAGGVDIDPKQEDHEYGRFAWFNDLEGNRVDCGSPRSPENCGAPLRIRRNGRAAVGFQIQAIERVRVRLRSTLHGRRWSAHGPWSSARGLW